MQDKDQAVLSPLDVHNAVTTNNAPDRADARGQGRARGRRVAAATMLFDKLDKNGDGVLSREELFGGLQRGGLCDEEEAEALFKRIDADADGTITREEYLQYFSNEVAQGGTRGQMLSSMIDAGGVAVVSYDTFVRHFIKNRGVEDELVRIVSEMVPPKETNQPGGPGQTDHQHVNACLNKLTEEDFSKQLEMAIPRLAKKLAEQQDKKKSSGAGPEEGGKSAKFSTEDDLPVAAYGGSEFFFKGLDGVLGLPSVDPGKSIEAEFRQRPDSDKTFKSWNSGEMQTTPKKEIDFVIAPYTKKSVEDVLTTYDKWELTHADGYGGRVAIRLEVFLHALCALGLDNPSHSTPTGKPFQRPIQITPNRGAPNLEEWGFEWEMLTEREAEKRVRKATMTMDKSTRTYISQLPQGAWEAMTWLDRLCFLEGKLSLADVEAKEDKMDVLTERPSGLTSELNVGGAQVSADDGPYRYGNYKTASSCAREDPFYLDPEEVFLVKIILLRFVKSQIEPIALRNALNKLRNDLAAKGEEELADRSNQIRTALARAFQDRQFQSKFAARHCRAAYEVVQEAILLVVNEPELEALIDHFQERLRKENFSRADIIGARLYTGPPYVKMNGAMRQKSGFFPEKFLSAAVLEGNHYKNTIFAAVSGLVKLSNASSIPVGGALYRGMAGIKLPGKFVTPEEKNGRGGVEFAFMSVTTLREVAVSYIDADKGLPTMFVFGVGTIDKGAAVSVLSQFPDEEEILIPPLSWIEVNGDPYLEQTDKGDVMMIPARVNCNLKSRTLEEIVSRRRHELLSMRESLSQELDRNLQVFEESFHDILEKEGKKDKFNSVKKGLVADFAERSSELERKQPSWFNDDANFQACINEAIDFKVENMAMLGEELFKHPQLLLSFASEGNEKCVSACLASGYAPTQRNEKGQTALHTAAMNGHADVVQILIEEIQLKEGHEEIIDLADSRHRTALHYGAECGFSKVVKILLEAGANVNKSDEGLDVLDDLLLLRTPRTPRKGRELNREKSRAAAAAASAALNGVNKLTPLHLAVSKGRTDVVEVLVQPRWKCEVMKTQSYKGLSALHMAASYGHADIVKLLLQAGHHINLEVSGGAPPLHMAAEGNKAGVVQVLLSNKCDINKLGPHRETALHVSVRNGHAEVTRLLMDADANANSLDEWGQTVLHLAATQGSSENVGMLLAKHKALLKEIDLDNRTPLHNAAEYGHVDACRKMLEFRCDISVRDRHLKTALQYAESHGHNRVATMLRKYATTGQLF